MNLIKHSIKYGVRSALKFSLIGHPLRKKGVARFLRTQYAKYKVVGVNMSEAYCYTMSESLEVLPAMGNVAHVIDRDSGVVVAYRVKRGAIATPRLEKLTNNVLKTGVIKLKLGRLAD